MPREEEKAKIFLGEVLSHKRKMLGNTNGQISMKENVESVHSNESMVA